MHYKSLTTLLLVGILSTNCCIAQTAVVEDFKPTSTTQQGKLYPKVNSERRVRVSIKAPTATRVQLDIAAVKYDLVKDTAGVWIGESAPQDEGFHYYQLQIDDAAVPDPGSLYFYGASRWGSGIDIPAKDQDFYAVKNVPHGQLRESYYFSKTSNSVRRVYIYTPPGYDKETSKNYPVLYLQHGMGENETGWGSQGKTNFIMDNLLAEGKANPFIIVMENSSINLKPGPRPTGTAYYTEAFQKVLFTDLIPYVEANFRVIPNQQHRAMAGLSMGGMQTHAIVVADATKFSHIGMFSSGTFIPSEITDIEAFKKNVKLVFMSFGGKETSGAARIGAAAEEWNKVGIKGVSYISPDTAHEWQSWRRSLYQFAQLLFK